MSGDAISAKRLSPTPHSPVYPVQCIENCLGYKETPYPEDKMIIAHFTIDINVHARPVWMFTFVRTRYSRAAGIYTFFHSAGDIDQ